MAKVWGWERGGNFVEIKDAHPEFGCTEFMDRHYIHYSSLPEYDDPEVEKTAEGGVKVYEVKSEFREQYPAYVADVAYGEGDVLCFNAAWMLWKWMAEVMPVLLFIKRWNVQEDRRLTKKGW